MNLADEKEKIGKEENGDNASKTPMCRFIIVLLIQHPSIDPSMITSQLGLNPYRSWRQGDQRATPKGKILSGTYPDTSWSYCSDICRERLFFSHLKKLLEDLEKHQQFFEQIVAEGGQIYLNVHLAGDENIGDVMSYQLMERLVTLKINLGIEVFPDF